tara:strand:- start:822 stop:1565 length:744 start_codon:yes stop_codon:yes gene_type:complete
MGQDEMQCGQCHPPQGNFNVREPTTTQQDAVTEALERGGVNAHQYQAATMESFDPDPDARALKMANEWLADFTATAHHRWPKREWLYLYGGGSDAEKLGGMGNGKTHLGIAIARRLIATQRLKASGYRFTTAERLILESEATFRSQATDSESKLLRTYESYEFLHIDDFGVRQPTPHAVRVLDELTKRREGKATIWTSNYSLRVIAEQHVDLQRIASRIAGNCGVGAIYAVKFEGPDRRILRSRGSS